MKPGLHLPQGFLARPAQIEDAEAAASVIIAREAAAGQQSTTTPDVVRHFWTTVGHGDQAIVIANPDGKVVATADIDNQGFAVATVFGHVAPGFQGIGLGSFLVGWGERWVRDHIDQAPSGARVVIRQMIPSSDAQARVLLRDRGYEHVRTTFSMQIDLDVPPLEPHWPEGIIPSPFRPGIDEREIHTAIEDAFRDVWGRPESSFERLLANRPSREEQADL